MKPSSKPEVVYKPKPPMMQISDEHLPHLDNIINGGLMRTVVPAHIEQQLLQAGYARKAVGGLMPTEHGYKMFMQAQNASQYGAQNRKTK